MNIMDKIKKFKIKIKHKKLYKLMISKGYITYHLHYSGSIFQFMIDSQIKRPLKNGKIGVFTVIDARDEWDGWGSTNIILGLVGYENEKLFKDMTFDEYMKCGILNTNI